MDGGSVLLGEEVLVPRAGGGHPQRFVELPLGEVFPTRPGGLGDRFGTDGHPEVGVVVDLAERDQRLVDEVGQHVLPVVADVLEVVTRGGRQAGSVGVEVADRGVVGDVGVGQLEPGHQLADRRVPGDDVLGHLRGDDGGAERFRHRGDLEDGVGVDWVVGSERLHAEAVGEHRLVPLHHGDRHAGNPALVEHRLGQARQLG